MEDNFGVQENDITSTNISSTISSEMRSDAIVAVIIATICMLIYIWFRFKDIRFASSAVIALVHDVLVVFSILCIISDLCGQYIYCLHADAWLVTLSMQRSLSLTVSVRIWHWRADAEDTDLKEVVNKSITQTLSQKYQYFPDNIYHGICAVYSGCIFHP